MLRGGKGERKGSGKGGLKGSMTGKGCKRKGHGKFKGLRDGVKVIRLRKKKKGFRWRFRDVKG